MLSRYVEKKPDDVDAWYMIAAGAERMQKYSRALDAYDKIIALDAKQADAWFGEARLLLTVVEDPQKGLDALSKALAAGFKDKEAVKALLASPQLLERDKVEAALKEHDMLPPPEPQRPAESQAPPQQHSEPVGDAARASSWSVSDAPRAGSEAMHLQCFPSTVRIWVRVSSGDFEESMSRRSFFFL